MSELTQKLESTHPDYNEWLPRWTKARDFAGGIDPMRAHDLANWLQGCATITHNEAGESSRIRALGATFASIARGAYILPTSDKMTYTEYVLYVLRGHCPSYVHLTLSGFLGLIFGNAPDVDLPGADALLKDADLQETPLVEYIEAVLSEVLLAGRYGVLLDSPPVTKDGLTVGDAEREGLRPYMAGYRAEDIRDWNDARIGGRRVATYYKLRERVRRGDGYDYDYRELFLGADGYYQIFWTREKKDGEYKDTTIVPLKGGAAMRTIPFYLYSPRGGRREIEVMPLADLIDLQHEYYQWAVEFANACFAVGIPTAAFFGFTTEEVEGLVLGGLNGIHATNENADAKYLEFTGQGLDALAARGVSILTNIAKFGGRMLTQDKAAAEAEGTVRIRASAESATLADMARACSRITTQMLQEAEEWGFGGGKAVFELGTDYMDYQPDPAMLKELSAMVGANQMALADFVAYQKRVNLIPDTRTDAQIMADLETQKEAGAADAQVKAETALAQTAARMGKDKAAA